MGVIQGAVNSMLNVGAVAAVGAKKMATDAAARTDALKTELADTQQQIAGTAIQTQALYEKYMKMSPAAQKANHALKMEIDTKQAQFDLMKQHEADIKARLGKKDK